ncbi:MAG TPA: hypothetical protein DCO79_02145 [Spirochaeta sp.]|nr:hypothetical protein [Spirochaeta sp.]
MYIAEFSDRYIEEAAVLLQQAQKTEFESAEIDYQASKELCRNRIEKELKSDVSGAYMVFEDDKLMGYAIAVIKRDADWGNSGWVNIGGWALKPEAEDLLPYLYQRIAEEWVKQNIFRHTFVVFAHSEKHLDKLFDLGFGKQQSYALLDLTGYAIVPVTSENLNVRKAAAADQAQLSGFSRLIADFQTKSPCFAGAPESYLKQLDDGFAELTADTDIDLYIIESEDKLVGYQGYYEEDLNLFIPEKSTELAVSAIHEDYRGSGGGYQLTSYCLNEQKKKGLEFVLTDWRSTNLLSSKFWSRMGFQSIAHRLVRLIDPISMK